jgi:hypothetical protein
MNYLCANGGGPFRLGQARADLPSFVERDINNGEYIPNVGYIIVLFLSQMEHGALCTYLQFSFISILLSVGGNTFLLAISHINSNK